MRKEEGNEYFRGHPEVLRVITQRHAQRKQNTRKPRGNKKVGSHNNKLRRKEMGRGWTSRRTILLRKGKEEKNADKRKKAG